MSEFQCEKASFETIITDVSRVKRGHFLMLMATGLVATSFPVGAAITNGMDSLVLTFLRFLLAAILFAPFVAWRYGLVLPSIRHMARYSILSACLVGFFWAMFTALQTTSALNTATIFALTPVITAGVSALLLKERLNKASRIALPVGIIGAVWVIFRGDPAALLSLNIGLGDGIFFMGTVAMGFYGPLIKHLHRGEPMAQMTFWTLVSGAVWLLFLSAPHLFDVVWTAVPMAVYGGIAYLSIFTTLVTFFVFQWSATVIGPTKVMSYTYLNPALVVFLGAALGGELPPPAIFPGLFLTLLATLILQR
ncbi:MAG: EamA family transporter [Rhodospirillales bacterium]|jgi:drug/metabolite transporter (DMT)-like permease|nr:EamA family transporter [Rhodospirillaceae bacterium]MBT3556447.1 EamA family transporter [Rhodospirillales bacterium]MBT4039296.1 EamA family transporter [Rhodospirillales bacterium]MBT4628248.1 EamA family transporter [Rhodospirillales bacterium]MBT5351997.1 EamA family transporter [Rhodospirillales bacterium]